MWTRGVTRGQHEKAVAGDAAADGPQALDARRSAGLDQSPQGGSGGSDRAAEPAADVEDGTNTSFALLPGGRRPASVNHVEHGGRDTRLWTKGEDDLLLDIVSKGQPPAPRWSWKLVADRIPGGRSYSAVSKHWYKAFKPKYGLPAPGRPLLLVDPTNMDVDSGDESDGDPPYLAYLAAPSAPSLQPSSVSPTAIPRVGFLAPFPPVKASPSSVKFCPPSPEARLHLYPAATSSQPAPKKPSAPAPEGHWTPEQIELLKKFGPDRDISWAALGARCGGRTGKSAQHKYRKLVSLGLVGKTLKPSVRPQPAKAASSRSARARRQSTETSTDSTDPTPIDPLAVPAVASIAGALAKVAGWWRGVDA